MQIKTIRVRRKSDDEVCTLNETDFDPALYEHVRARLSRPKTSPDPDDGEDEIVEETANSDASSPDPETSGESDDDAGTGDDSGDGLDGLSDADLRGIADELGVSASVKLRKTLLRKIRKARESE